MTSTSERMAEQRTALMNPDQAGSKAEPIEPRRVLFFGKRKSRSCCTGALVAALRARGLEVLWVNCSLIRRWLGSFGMHRVVRMIRRLYAPDLCFVFFHDLPPLLMAEFSREIPTVVWMEEQTSYIESSHIEYVRNVRLLCLSTPSLVRAYWSLGIEQATFMMSGFSPVYHRPWRPGGRRPAFERDVAFIGGPGHMGNRPEFLSWLSERLDLEIFGLRSSWQPYLSRFPRLRLRGEVRPKGYAKVCATSRIVLGFNQTNDAYLYFSNRFFLTLACRGFHLVHYVPGMEKVFENGRHLVWFHSPEECVELARHYLARDDERERIARQGYELVMRRHRYEDRIAEILAILAGEQEPSCPVEAGAGLDEVLLPRAEELPPVLLAPAEGGGRPERLRRVEWA